MQYNSITLTIQQQIKTFLIYVLPSECTSCARTDIIKFCILQKKHLAIGYVTISFIVLQTRDLGCLFNTPIFKPMLQ